MCGLSSLTAGEIVEISEICPGGVQQDVDLSELSSWRVGGKADIIICPSSTAEVSALNYWFSERKISPVVIGLTTNLLFDDLGLRAPCVQIGRRLSKIQTDQDLLLAQAGIWVPALARSLMKKGLCGAEHICGIPGTLGGLICMNGGSQRNSIASSVQKIVSVDRLGHVNYRAGSECGFDYRSSVFQTNGEIITEAVLRFESADPGKIASKMREILRDRRLKFPRKLPNCGSVFKSDPKIYKEIGTPGAIIEALGFKGRRIGAAEVSSLHANFIVNHGGATSKDILSLINEITEAVERSVGYFMAAEVLHVQPNGNVKAANRDTKTKSD